MANLRVNYKIMAIALLLLFITFCVVMFLLIDNESKCQTSPFIYSAKMIKKNNDTSILCSCDVSLEGKPAVKVWFDDKGIYDKNPLNPVLEGSLSVPVLYYPNLSQ